MGAKDSKPCCITYEDAVKQVTASEFKRLQDAFKRASTLSGYMTQQTFVREVMGDGVPPKLAECMFAAFGGAAKGLSFKDLLCGLVLITKGTREEKMKFIYGLYANETGSHVQKDEMVRLVQACEGSYVPEAVADCFLNNEKVSYEDFHEWLQLHEDATAVTRWLLKEPTSVALTNDSETPTFYQTLAGVTHLEELDIIELEKRYWLLKGNSKTGKFDLDTFTPLVSPPVPSSVCKGFFDAFDENRDNHIDFKEMACGISACCRGPELERHKFCFKIFDADQANRLSRQQLVDMLSAMMAVEQESPYAEMPAGTEANASALADDLLREYDANNGAYLSREDYLVWTLHRQLPNAFLRLLFQVCHVVLGLKPSCKDEEQEIISEWVAREDRRGMQVGQVWYLIEMAWWRMWREWVTHTPAAAAAVLTEPHASTGLLGSPRKNRYLKKYGGYTAQSDNPNVVATNFTPVSRDDAASVSSMGSAETLVSTGGGGGGGGGGGVHSRSSSPALIAAAASPVFENGCLQLASSTSSASLPAATAVMRAPASVPQKPGAIDNTPLVVPNTQKVMMLTSEGGKLRRSPLLAPARDFQLVPEPVWKTLSQWYGGSPALPRTVIPSSVRNPIAELELHPISLRLLRHQAAAKPIGPVSWHDAPGYNPPAPVPPRRYLAYMAAFSRWTSVRQLYEFLCSRLRIRYEDMRLWKFMDENTMELLEEEEVNLVDLEIDDNQQILIEVRNKDLTWPEELSNLAKNRASRKLSGGGATERGATGLNNLGNTCFLNSALQCVSNTRPLTQYFKQNLHLYELNRTNRLGMRGHMAMRYGDLIDELWSGTARVVAPLKMRWTIGKYAPRFNGFQQHDCQELLAFLLDGLHEDLNRVHDKPYIELKDSGGRPDEEVAQEAWQNHLRRNQSIVVDLLHGQLRSQVRCKECSHVSVRFDPFNFLSLPLPMESCIHLEVTVVTQDGAVPVRYGVRLNMDERYRTLKAQLARLSSLNADQLLLAEIHGAVIKSIPNDDHKVKMMLNGGTLCAYEIPEPQPDGSTVVRAKEVHSFTQIQRMNCNGGLHRQPSSSSGRSTPSDEVTPASDIISNGGVQITVNPPAAAGVCMNPGGPSRNGVATTPSATPPAAAAPAAAAAAPTPAAAPGHRRQGSNVSTTSSTNGSTASTGGASVTGGALLPDLFDRFVVAVHRKMIRNDVYFLSSQKSRPSLFGFPLILPCHEYTTQQELYQCVWTQVGRLVSPLPPNEHGVLNHALDCDDSLGYEYPFILKAVQRDGFTCAWCPWFRFCRGCKIECCDADFCRASAYVAVDWDPTALHLRYQASLERVFVDHGSVEQSRRLQTEPIDLATCLQAFTKWEELGEDELYYCSKCRQHRLAQKKLDLWRLPPVLVIHLKRFQFVNGRWVKSHKIVKFPPRDLDPSSFLAPRARALSLSRANTIEETQLPNGNVHPQPDTSNLFQDQYYHWVHRGADTTTPNYDLYAIACHTGILGGGHYVCYAKNPNNKWYCYNDSSCKETTMEQVDGDSAYILFYERAGLGYERYQPDVSGLQPQCPDPESDFDSDYRKNCCVQ